MASITAAGPVGFVGAGSMGSPMVARLLGAGVPVELYARRPEVRAKFAEQGVKVHDSAAELARSVGTCIVCLFSGDQLEDLALGDDGLIGNLPAGAVLVNHTTIATATVDRVATAARARDIEFLDAPVSGTSEAITEGKLTVLAGGAAAAVEQAEPYLRTYSAQVLRTGGIGSATRAKLLNNLTFAAHAQVAQSVVGLAAELGLAAEQVVEAFAACSGDSRVFGYLRAQGIDVLSKSVPYIRKDVLAVESDAADLGVDLGLLREIVGRGPLPFS
ncbi:NAD(P)-dependent oxidoreductase [Nocardia jinanensis]|nr:NAD(P)-dependent oxidoreductase [Nocardia jinanensis]